MKKPSFIKRFLSFLLRLAVVGALMAAFAVITFEGVTYYLTGTLMDVDDVNAVINIILRKFDFLFI